MQSNLEGPQGQIEKLGKGEGGLKLTTSSTNNSEARPGPVSEAHSTVCALRSIKTRVTLLLAHRPKLVRRCAARDLAILRRREGLTGYRWNLPNPGGPKVLDTPPDVGTVIIVLEKSYYPEYPNILQTTEASEEFQLSSQTVPHSLKAKTSTLPSYALFPPTSLADVDPVGGVDRGILAVVVVVPCAYSSIFRMATVVFTPALERTILDKGLGPLTFKIVHPYRPSASSDTC
ncbi:hypothetical protein MAR_033095 [Mya arenaria]|uniref:Uncharacterized protein n=1 Tax=Mya arenaria TaxID=6604 RepID=A0ABY7G810_MYAAR|nr:hypothetical protein MAR_033095 [Mya arenaria]